MAKFEYDYRFSYHPHFDGEITVSIHAENCFGRTITVANLLKNKLRGVIPFKYERTSDYEIKIIGDRQRAKLYVEMRIKAKVEISTLESYEQLHTRGFKLAD